MDLIIKSEQRDALLAYLMERPFKEVAGAVAWLQQLPPAAPPLPASEKTPNPFHSAPHLKPGETPI